MRIDHVSLLVADVPRALRFYSGTLGLRELSRPPGAAPGAWLALGEQQLHLIAEREPGQAAALHPGYADADAAIGYGSHVALAVPDLDATLAALGANDVAPVGDVDVRGDGVRRAFLRDPDGHVVEMIQAP